MTNNKNFILSYSGGKDSTATLIYLVVELGFDLSVVFCDTGNESPDTYQYINYISELLKSWGHSPIIKVQGEYNFLSLAKKQKIFPCGIKRFCTVWLKLKPFLSWLVEQGFEDPVVITGIRRDESHARKDRKEWEYSDHHGCEMWNPIIDWTAKQVFAIHKKYGIEINPMYKKGFKRVGCFPCFNAGRLELLLLDRHYPERIHEIQKWEKEVGGAYFPPRRPGKIWAITDQIHWAKKSDPQMSPVPLFGEEKLCAYAELGVCE